MAEALERLALQVQQARLEFKALQDLAVLPGQLDHKVRKVFLDPLVLLD
jgi:hypothetical protein